MLGLGGMMFVFADTSVNQMLATSYPKSKDRILAVVEKEEKGWEKLFCLFKGDWFLHLAKKEKKWHKSFSSIMDDMDHLGDI